MGFAMYPVVAALFLPLLGAIVLRAGASRLKAGTVAKLAIASVGLAHLLAWAALAHMLAEPPGARIHDITLFPLMQAGEVRVDFLLRWDALSQVMLLLVTGVSLLVHIYSVSYMKGDDHYAGFFAKLNLFTFSMLLLVLAGNFILLFAGWEMVGLCSCLLIGFWGTRPAAAAAGLKAFVVNRVGDAGFVIALVMLAGSLGTLDYGVVFTYAPWAFPPGSRAALALALLLFCGAVGKSAQFPLHVWLPGAKEGPLPVSALIHAATTATAGVYMVCRCGPLFALSPGALAFVAWLGAFTALFAGLCALAQRDLVRLLAFSTVSQLGFMFLGAGVGAYGAAMFHMVTHAFSKALLLLCAGVVVHALAGEADIGRMGGLRRRLPWTFWSFLAGALALSGAPLTAGFFSEVRILEAAFLSHPDGWALGAAGLAVGVLTTLYIFRAFWLVFFGRPRFARGLEPHEAPPLMRWPVVILAGLSLVAGLLWLPESWAGLGSLGDFLAPGLWMASAPPPSRGEAVMAAAAAALVAGLGLAWMSFRRGGKLLEKAGAFLEPVRRVLFREFYIDELYRRWVVEPLYAAAGKLEEGVEKGTIDSTADSAGEWLLKASTKGDRWQTGLIRDYAIVFIVGVALLLLMPVIAALLAVP